METCLFRERENNTQREGLVCTTNLYSTCVHDISLHCMIVCHTVLTIIVVSSIFFVCVM